MIGLVTKCNVRYWLKHRWQLLLMVAGLALGVAVVFAVDIANESAKRAFALSLDSVTGRTTHQLVSSADGIDELIYTRLRVDMGIRSSAPMIDGNVVLGGESLQVLGVDIFAESLFRSVAFGDTTNTNTNSNTDTNASRSQLALLEPGTMILTGPTASRLNLAVGDSLITEPSGYSLKLINIITGEQQAAFESVVMMDISTAQDLLQMHGKLSRVDLVVNDATILDQIRRAFPALSVIEAATRNQSLKEMTSAFHTNLLAMSLLGVLVGAFLIYNTVTLAVLQRRSLFGVLRATGVTRNELFKAVVIESLVVAMIGTLFGLLIGYLLGHFLLELVTRTINDLYFALDVKRVDFGFSTVAKAIALGLGSALVATIPPALEASRSPPVTVLQSSAIEQRAGSVIPFISLAGLLLIAVGALITLLSERSLWAGFAALMSIVIGYSLLIPLVLRLIANNARQLLQSTSVSTLTQYALRSLTASISRTSVAIAALVIAVSATAGVGIMIGSFRLSVVEWLAQTLQSDIYIRAETDNSEGLPQSLPAQLQSLPEVKGVRLAHITQIETSTGPVGLLAVQLTRERDSGFVFLQSIDNHWQSFRRGESVFVSEPYAWKQGIKLGDTISLHTAIGEQTSTVAGIMRDYGTGGGLVVMDLQHYRKNWADQSLTSIGIHLADAVDIEKAKQSIRGVIDPLPTPLRLRSNVEIRRQSLEVFDRTFAITHVLRILTIGVAFIGILSALLALALERSSEFALLRALGLTPFELRKLVTVQCVIMGLIAGLLALPLGYVMSQLLINVINQRSFGWTMGFYVSPTILFQTVALALVAATLAGWYPSRKLSRMSPAEALRQN